LPVGNVFETTGVTVVSLMSTDSKNRPEAFATRRGYGLAYRRQQGRTPWVVFLGGFRSDMEGTKAQYLAEWCEARGQAYLRFDYSGHGRSDGVFEEGTISQWTQDTLDLLSVIQGAPCVLVGSSMGGWIMLRVAEALQRQVVGLVGVAAAPDFTRDLMQRDLSDTQRYELKQSGRIRMVSEYDPKGFILTESFMKDGNSCCLLDRPIAIEAPVRLLQGCEDVEVPWDTALRLSTALATQNVQVHLLKDGDHRLSKPEQLAILGQTLADLLAFSEKP